MKLRLTAGLAVSSTLAWAYQPRVYLLPTKGMLTGKEHHNEPLSLNLPQTNKVLANHLGLDMYESLEDHGDSKDWQRLLKNGDNAFWRSYHHTPRSTVMLVVHTDRPEDLISALSNEPFPEHPDFYINATLSSHDVSALMSTYVAHAKGNFDTVSSGLKWYLNADVDKLDADGYEYELQLYRGPSQAARLFADEYMAIEQYKQGPWKSGAKFPLTRGDPALYEPSDFAAFEISSLDLLADEFGRDSAQYEVATLKIREWMDVPSWNGEDTLALVIKPKTEPQGHANHARSIAARASAPGSAPIYSCFDSAETCGNSTGGCSGRGSCIPVSRAGRTCYTCKCSPTKSEDGTSTTYWAGQRCERKDVSSSFVLLVGTVIGVLVVAFGSVSLLYAVGDEQLPGTLTGGAVPVSKHD